MTFMANFYPVTERLTLGALFLALGAPVAAGQDALVRARQLYNQRDYLAAIVAITDAGSVGDHESAAALVRGRARLERFRQTSRLAELVGAREELRRIDPSGLGARGRLELEIGLAGALYLGGSFGAAAELFDSLLARTRVLTDPERDRLLDWWVTAVDRQSDGGSARDRQALYLRVLDRMEEQLRQGSTSASVSYWLAAAARGLGDLERAWNAAVAGWVRAPLTNSRGASLRADLERLVLQAIIPERARRQTNNPEASPDTIAAMAAMAAEWELIKQNWTPR